MSMCTFKGFVLKSYLKFNLFIQTVFLQAVFLSVPSGACCNVFLLFLKDNILQMFILRIRLIHLRRHIKPGIGAAWF